jgi:hypothetical protein
MQHGPQHRVVAKLRISEDGRDLNARGPNLAHERERESPLLLEPGRGRDARPSTRRRGEPFLREIELRAEHPRVHPVPQRGRDRDLAIGNLAERATVLPRHADRVRPLLGKTRAVQDQDARSYRYLGAEALPQPVGIPRRIGDEVLRRLVAARLAYASQHRAHRLARAVTEQAEEVPPKRAALRAMTKRALEWLQPCQEAVDPRRRIAWQHAPVAYRNLRRSTTGSVGTANQGI